MYLLFSRSLRWKLSIYHLTLLPDDEVTGLAVLAVRGVFSAASIVPGLPDSPAAQLPTWVSRIESWVCTPGSLPRPSSALLF
jgi:hypothetical protein